MLKKIIKKIIIFVEIIILWYVGYILLNKDCLPSPFKTLSLCINMLITGEFNQHIYASLKRLILGMIFGGIIAIPIGILLGFSEKADIYLGQMFNFLYTIPKVVFLPIILVVMGIGDLPKIFLIALIVFFQQAVVIRDAVKNIKIELIQYFLTLNATKFCIIKHLILPSCIPAIITSLRASLSVAIALLFISENFAAVSGLGYFATKCMNERNYEKMYSTIIILAIIGLLLYNILDIAEKKICKWK